MHRLVAWCWKAINSLFCFVFLDSRGVLVYVRGGGVLWLYLRVRPAICVRAIYIEFCLLVRRPPVVVVLGGSARCPLSGGLACETRLDLLTIQEAAISVK